MNLLWIAALMFVVLLEKILPGARWFTRVAGVIAVFAGAWMLLWR
jgi:predicted metal-binding membrane protein